MKRKTGGKLLSTNCEFLVVEGLDSGNETNTIKIKKHNLRKVYHRLFAMMKGY